MGSKSPDNSALRIEALKIINGYELNFSVNEKPIFELTTDLNTANFVLVNGTYICLNFYRFSAQQGMFKAFPDVQGISHCFEIIQNGVAVKPKGQPISTLTPAKAEQSGTAYKLTKKGRLDLGV